VRLQQKPSCNPDVIAAADDGPDPRGQSEQADILVNEKERAVRFRILWLAAVVSAFSLPAAVGAQPLGDGVHAPSAGQALGEAAAEASAGGSSAGTAGFNTMDLDQDGFISRDEARGTNLENQFDRLDRDHDGQLSPSEVDAVRGADRLGALDRPVWEDVRR
jgi:hypothetical protein